MRSFEGRQSLRDGLLDHGQEAADGLRGVHDLHDDGHVIDQRPRAALQQTAGRVQAEDAAQHCGAGQARGFRPLHQFLGGGWRKPPVPVGVA